MGEMIDIAIMEKFGWTFDQLMSNPVPYLDLIREKMNIDAKKAKAQK